MYEPLYLKHYDIVNGVIDVEGITKEIADETPTKQKEECFPAKEKGVQDFWLNAMKNHPTLAEQIQERDKKALKYLKDIKWYKIIESQGFKLEFHFDTNPFFKNLVLTKTYHMIDEDEPILEKVVGTEIEWYPGKCLTQKVLKKKPRKGANNTKPISKTEDCASFFNFFGPPQVSDIKEKIDEDTLEQLQNQMELHYDIGSTMRDKIIPHAVSWFIGDFEGIIAEEDEDKDDDQSEDDDGGKKTKGAAGGEGQQGERAPKFFHYR